MYKLLIMLALLVPMPVAAQVSYPPVATGINVADVRSMDLTLDASGVATWDVTAGGTAQPFGGVPDVTHLPQAVNSTDMLVCNFTTRTATTIVVKCLRVNTVAALLTGLFGGTIAGLKVNLIARYKAP